MNLEKHGKRPAEQRQPEESGVPPAPAADSHSLRQRVETRIHVLNQRLRGKHQPFRVRVY